MLEAEQNTFYTLFAVGLGLVVAGAVNALRAAGGRAAAAGAAAGLLVTGGVMAALQVPVSLTAGLVGGGLLAAVAVTGLLTAGRRTAGWGLAAVVGLAAIGYGGVRFEAAERAAAEADTADLTRFVGLPPVVTVAHAASDTGRPVPLARAESPRPQAELDAADRDWFGRNRFPHAVIRRGPAEDGVNCHGWTFTGGRYGVRTTDVPAVVADNGYAPVSQPQVGDLVLYSQDGQTADHTAVVRAVTPDGVVLVEGKWGWMGVYLHPVEASPYGTRFTYLRSPRAGHLLKGMPAAGG